jgi:hypothetical protein
MVCLQLNAQKVVKCAVDFDPNKKKTSLKNPSLEIKIKEFYSKKESNFSLATELIKIPVVVHIVHNTADGSVGGAFNSNISDDQVYSQIKVLNEDYRKKTGTKAYNTSSIGADMQIEFVLANKTPEGNPSNGIVRKYSPKFSFDVLNEREALSELSYWDSNKYLNIWVTNLKNGYLGFGEFPFGEFEGLEKEEVNEKIDGVYINYAAFGNRIGTTSTGTYSYGRTTTHEIGHWLGLIHPWGDEYCGTDFCEDTPKCEEGNLETVCEEVYSFCSGTRTKNMIENFMDYTPDSCMNTFTNDQKNRVRAILELSKRRKRLIENSKFNLPKTAEISVLPLENPTLDNNIKMQVLLPSYQDFVVRLFNSKGIQLYEKSYLDSPSRIIEIPKSTLAPGIYFYKIEFNYSQISGKIIF